MQYLNNRKRLDYLGFYGVNRANHILHCDYFINWGEPNISCSNTSMANNNKTENVKRMLGSRISS